MMYAGNKEPLGNLQKRSLEIYKSNLGQDQPCQRMDDSQILQPRAVEIQKAFQGPKSFDIRLLAFTQICKEVSYNASALTDSSPPSRLDAEVMIHIFPPSQVNAPFQYASSLASRSETELNRTERNSDLIHDPIAFRIPNVPIVSTIFLPSFPSSKKEFEENANQRRREKKQKKKNQR